MLALNWIVFLVSSIWSWRPSPQEPYSEFIALLIYVYVCVWEGETVITPLIIITTKLAGGNVYKTTHMSASRRIS